MADLRMMSLDEAEEAHLVLDALDGAAATMRARAEANR